MKKTSNITKYDMDWQVVRSKVKGSKTPLEEKLSIVSEYFDKFETLDALERVVNWLEGLALGYKAANNLNAIQRIKEEIISYEQLEKDLPKEELTTSDDNIEKMLNYSFEERYNLWTDLFKRNQKWLEKGYFQKEINSFMDNLYQTFILNDEENKIKSNYSFSKLEDLRLDAAVKPNTHNFFF